MSEEIRMWVEIIFNVAYLLVVWSLVALMVFRLREVADPNRKVTKLVIWAFALLALGDSMHVGFRVLAYVLGGLDVRLPLFGNSVGLVGIGALSTSITVTLFYVLGLELWRERFQRRYGWFEYVLVGSALLRLFLMALPFNDWNSSVPPQPWSTIRNLPLLLQGLGLAYLVLRDARPAKDRTFTWIGISILVSFACYIPVILFVQQSPAIGMLMIPKTLAYLAIAFLAYIDLYPSAKAGAVPAVAK
jgi:hypothetical protein